MDIMEAKLSMSKTPFALRLPPPIKDAAQAMVNARPLYRWEGEGSEARLNGLAANSLNDALNTLLREGLVRVLDAIDEDLRRRVEPEHARFHEMMTFLMAHPAASHVLPENLPEGSEVRTWLAEAIEEMNDPDNGAPGSTANRAWVAEEYSAAQRHLHNVVAAKGAIQRALAA